MRSNEATPASTRKLPPSPRVLAYHELSTWPSEDIYQLTPEAFSTHVSVAKELFLREGTSFEFTFDDAHISQVELAAPILEQASLYGIFFAPAAWIGCRNGIASWRNLRALLQSGHRIGSHGNTHALLTHCTTSELTEELLRSRLTLEDKLGCAVTSLSLPGGRCNSDVAAQASATGYKHIYTSQPSWGTPRPYQSAKEVKLIGRLAVRRKMKTDTIAQYLRKDPYTVIPLAAGFHLRKGVRHILGDQRYQQVWRRMLRSPINHV